MAFKTVQSWFGYGSSGTQSAAQLESRNGVLQLPQDSVVIDGSSRQGNKLGEGTFAKVYFGMYMGKERAIKVFNLTSDSTLDMALEEYEKLNRLKHPNIVCVYGMWKDPHKGRNAPAIVMELCDHSLHDYVEQYYPRSSITREHKLKILHDITCAMVFLHSKNVVHGDLRTPNVLVKRINDEVTAKLTDFGMARTLDPQHNSHVTKSAADADYLPPEVFNHKEQRDRKKNWAKLTTQVDVFMFGPVAIELACGEFPKPAYKHEMRKGKVTRTFSEIERREQYLTKVKTSDRAITDVIVKQCLAENPEDRGTFLVLQRIVKGFQRQRDQPDSANHFQDLYEEAQEELEDMRSQLEASLYQQDLEQKWKDEMKQLQDAYDDLKCAKDTLKDHIKQLEDAIQLGNYERTRLAEQLSAEKVASYQTKAELEKSKEKVTELGTVLQESGKQSEEIKEAKKTFQKDLNVLIEAKTRAEKEIEKMTHIVKYLKEEAKTKDEDYRELESKYKVLEDGRENPQLTEKLEDAKLKLQKAQADLENEQRNYELEKDTTKHLRTENAQLNHSLSSQEREVQALMDKGSHKREVLQQVVKLLQTQVAAVRSDLDQERNRQSALKDSVEQLLTRSFIVRFLKTELVSRAAEFQKCRDELQKCRDEHQKCRDELKTTMAERDRLRHTIAMKQYMDQHFHKLQEQMRRNLVQIVTKVIAGVREVSASGVSELNKEVQQFQDQTSFTSSAVHQSLTAPAPVSKNLTEDGTRPQEILCMSQPQSGVHNALVKPGGAEGALVQCSSPGSAMDFEQVRDRHARTTGQTSRAPLLQGPADFNVESFMNGCKDGFLNDVKAKPIAAYLKSENVIPPQLNEDIDGADTKKGTLLLFEHFKDQGRPESILILCKVMEESAGGHPRMINFAKVLKDKLNKCPH